MKRQLQLVAELWLVFLAMTSVCCQHTQVRPQSYQEQAMKVIAPMLALDQVSACDGEQLHLKCPADLTIGIVTVSKTTLGRDSTRRSKRSPLAESADQSNRVAGETTQQSTGPSSPSSLSGNQISTQGQQICPPRAAVTLTSTDQNVASNQTETGSKQLRQCPEVSDDGKARDDDQAALDNLVLLECQQHNSCTLDLSWQNVSQTNQNLTISGELSLLINGPEPPNVCSPRKVLEVVYKCNPMKVKKSIACRGQTASIECPDDKVILIGSASYGSEPIRLDNRRAYEKCSLNSSQEQTVMKQPLTSTCSSKQSATNVMIGECSLKRKCRLEANNSAFGETSCPPNWPLEYLTYIYICMSLGNLNKNATAYVQQYQQLSQTNNAGGNEAPPFVASSNVSSSSLLSSPTPSNFISPPAGPSGLFGPLNQSDSRQQSSQSNSKDEDVGLLSALPVDQTQPADFTGQDGQGNPMTRVLSVVRADPELSGLNPLNWNGMQRARYVWLRYRPQLIWLGVFSLTTILLAFTVRVCKQHSTSKRKDNCSSSSTSGSSSSSCRKSNSTSASCSSTSSSSSSSASTLAAAGHKSLGASAAAPTPSSNHLKKHNSCSESCFSLDDYNCFNATGGQLASADSPALISNPTPDDQQQHQLGQPPHSASSFQGSARPKFWSFYGNEQVGSLRLASGHQHQHQINPAQNLIQRHNTMRATTRTTFLNSRHQPPVVPPLDPGAQVNYQQASGGGDQYLLAMASVLQAPGHQGWCLSGANQTYSGQQLSPNDQQLLTLNAANLAAAAPATTAAPTSTTTVTAPQVQCAFHAQSSGQQQQMLMQTNSNNNNIGGGVQLELPQLQLQQQHQHQLTTDNVINNLNELHHHHHHLHHLPHLNHSHNHNQHDQQQQQM